MPAYKPAHNTKFNSKTKTKSNNGLSKQAGAPAKKKALGQHFLTRHSVVDKMINAVTVTAEHNVLEIGCGDGFLTQAILEQTPCAKLLAVEIDPAWIGVVKLKIKDPRLVIKHRDILEVDWAAILKGLTPLVMLANLPYQITFPILHKLQEHKELFQEGVIMIQEEVAQKLLATRGRNLSQATLFFQHHFEWKSVEKIDPKAFNPPPTVFSRTLHFKPKHDVLPVEDKEAFWQMVRTCFAHPRQTLKNNLRQAKWSAQRLATLPENYQTKRAQELTLEDFLQIFKY